MLLALPALGAERGGAPKPAGQLGTARTIILLELIMSPLLLISSNPTSADTLMCVRVPVGGSPGTLVRTNRAFWTTRLPTEKPMVLALIPAPSKRTKPSLSLS